MATLFTIFLWIVVVLACILLALFICFLVIQIKVLHYVHKLIYELPWMKWLTLDELVSMGYSRAYSRAVLPILHEHGYLEVRVMAGVGENDLWVIEKLKFHSMTVKFYEFRLIKRGGRRRRRRLFKLPTFGWEPAPA